MVEGRRREAGSALMLVPAGVLVLIVLGALALDLSNVGLVQREIHSIVSAAANDAAGLLSEDALRDPDSPRVEIDELAARQLLAARVSDQTLPGELIGSPTFTVDDTAVTVTVVVEVPYAFMDVAPGAADGQRVRVSVSASLVLP